MWAPWRNCGWLWKLAVDPALSILQVRVSLQTVSLTLISNTLLEKARVKVLSVLPIPAVYSSKLTEETLCWTLLPSDKRFRRIKGRTTRMINSFVPQAVRILNGWSGFAHTSALQSHFNIFSFSCSVRIILQGHFNCCALYITSYCHRHLAKIQLPILSILFILWNDILGMCVCVWEVVSLHSCGCF